MQQILASEWLANGAERFLCTLPCTIDDLARRFGLVFEALNADLWLSRYAVVAHEDMVFLLSAVPGAPEPACFVNVEVRGDARSPAQALQAITEALGCAVTDLRGVAPDLTEAPWAVLRATRGGARAVWSYFRDRALAEQMCLRLQEQERDSHHAYSIEFAGP